MGLMQLKTPNRNGTKADDLRSGGVILNAARPAFSKPAERIQRRVEMRLFGHEIALTPRASWGAVRLALLAGLFWLASPSTQAANWYLKRSDWVETLLVAKSNLLAAALPEPEAASAAEHVWLEAKADFPTLWDWAYQDSEGEFGSWFRATDSKIEQRRIGWVIAQLLHGGEAFQRRLDTLLKDGVSSTDPRWLRLYVDVCEQRRAERLQTVVANAPRIVFIKHRTVRPSFFAYTEGQSDAQNERHFVPGAELCVLDLSGSEGKVRTLLSDPRGAIRDPAVSWDGKRVLFAWKKALDDDDYHLYELTVASGAVRQITSGKGFADYEPTYLPSGDIIFASTRCVQTVDCWWTEVSNLYTCDADGRYLRRLGFDQVHTVYPQVMDDGRVIYTRWDYNDRGQIFPQPLFQMNADGTAQTEFYGNNSWFPTTIAHARGIPGTQKALAILCGHHSTQAGKLAVIDPTRGRQENSGVQLVAPIRETPADRIDSYGQSGELWQYPYPLNETECLVTYAPLGWDRPHRRQGDADFGIYWMDFAGHRELLAYDAAVPCSQPVPLVERTRPVTRASHVDYRQTNGTYYVQDIYQGPGLAGVPRGTIKKLRVVALEFRAAGVGNNSSGGPGGGALISTPVSIGNGTWDVKRVLGDAKVHEDGSALFTVPARTPMYFQALDERGYAVQTMRSWSTLQPGETFSCVGCHDNKNTAVRASDYQPSLALKAGLQPLQPFQGPARGFSFRHEIQPILDQHCVRCHKDRAPVESLVRGENRRPLLKRPRPANTAGDGLKEVAAFSLLGTENEDPFAKRRWSDAYLLLTQSRPSSPDDEAGAAFRGDPGGRVVHWISSQSAPEPQPPYSAGADRSELMTLLETGHQGVKLTRAELERIACWIDLLVPYCGDYLEANAWTDDEKEKYQRYANKRRQMEELEQANIRDLIHSGGAVNQQARLAPSP